MTHILMDDDMTPDEIAVTNDHKRLYDKKQAAEQEEADAKAAVKAYLLSLFPDGESTAEQELRRANRQRERELRTN